jgi:hypothetical protein
MAEDTKTIITRTITVGDLTPQELASSFAQMDSGQQAAFFHALHEETQSWPGAPLGWLGQATFIADDLTKEGKLIIRDLRECFN